MLFCLKFAFADAAALTLKTTSEGDEAGLGMCQEDSA